MKPDLTEVRSRSSKIKPNFQISIFVQKACVSNFEFPRDSKCDQFSSTNCRTSKEMNVKMTSYRFQLYSAIQCFVAIKYTNRDIFFKLGRLEFHYQFSNIYSGCLSSFYLYRFSLKIVFFRYQKSKILKVREFLKTELIILLVLLLFICNLLIKISLDEFSIIQNFSTESAYSDATQNRYN